MTQDEEREHETQLDAMRATIKRLSADVARAENEPMRDRDDSRCRRATQTLIEVVGANGPMSLEQAVGKALKKIEDLEAENERMSKALDDAGPSGLLNDPSDDYSKIRYMLRLVVDSLDHAARIRVGRIMGEVIEAHEIDRLDKSARDKNDNAPGTP